jgi:cell division septal protein FtsQ
MLSSKKNSTRSGSFRRKGKTLYNSKQYSNPYFKDKGTKISQKKFSISHLKAKLIFLLVIIFISASIWFLLISKFFTIKNYSISGGVRVDSEIVRSIGISQESEKRWFIFNQSNFFIFDQNELAQKLNTQFAFDELTITKKFPAAINIKFTEKQIALIWQEDGNYYSADKNGYIIAGIKQNDIASKTYPLIVNDSDAKILNNKTTVDDAYLDYIFNLVKKLSDQKYKIKNYFIDNEYYTVKVILDGGPMLYFNINEDIAKQAQKLSVIKNEKLRQDFNKKIYIDLRYGDMVFYK